MARVAQYRFPQASGELTDEAVASDRALAPLLQTDRAALHIGNDIMDDLARWRLSQRSP